MPHNPSDTSAAIQPPVSAAPASNTESGGSASDGPVGAVAQGVSEVSDTVTLTSTVEQAYAGFDPSIHAVDPATGQPRMRKGGGYALKRGRKPGVVAAETHKTSTIRPAVGAESPGATISNRQAAQMVCGLTVSGLCTLLGPEWEPEGNDERKALIDGTEAYLDATGGLEMSPATGLLFVWGGYSAKRVALPETQSRLKKFGAWAIGLFRRGK